MQIKLSEHFAVIHRDNGPRIYRESTFWYHVKRTLQAMGMDVIAKRMWKDGHLVSDEQHYVRTRKGDLALWQTDYAIREVYEDYNHEGLVEVAIERA